MRSIRPSWGPLPWVLALLGSMRGWVEAGPRASTIPDWGSSHSHLQKWGPAV